MIPLIIATTQFYQYLLTERRVSANTFAAYKTDIDQLCTFLSAQSIAELAAVDVPLLKKYLAHLYNRGISAKSTMRKISAIKIFFTYSARVYTITNSAKMLQFPKIPKRLPQFLSAQEMEDLFAAAQSDTGLYSVRNKTMLYLLYVSGMRVTELISLRVSDLHPDTFTITVSGKGGKQRLIPIPQAIMVMVQEYLNTEQRTAMTIKGKKKAHADDILFVVKHKGRSQRMTRQAFWGILNDIWAKTGHERTISPHKLRHSFATHMLKNGAHLRSLQLLLGHESLSTVQIYTHIDTSYARKLYDKKHRRS